MHSRRRYLWWALLAFIAVYMFRQPTHAAHTAHSVLGGLSHAADSLSRFVNAL